MKKNSDVKKDLEYYLGLNYKTEIIPIPEEEGGGFEAAIPELGKYAFIGYGETPQEALEDLQKTKKEYFEEFKETGIEIPEPEEEKRSFRGEYLLRMPKVLHRELYNAAKQNDISLNQYINFLLTSNFQIFQIGELVTQCFEHLWKGLWTKSKTSPTLETTIPEARTLKRGGPIGA